MRDKSVKAVEVFDRNAEAYAEKFHDQTRYTEGLNQFCNWLPFESASVLELACGPGNVTRYLLDKRPQLDILATDMAPQMLELARQNVPGPEYKKLDCRNFISLNRKFNGIMASFLLPYLNISEATRLIYDASLCLNPGGVLYLSTMEAPYLNTGWLASNSLPGSQLWFNYYQAGDLIPMLKQVGFSQIEEFHFPIPENDAPSDLDLVLVARK